MSDVANSFTIRPYQPGDETAILNSFNEVFREVCGESYVDRDLTFWRWEFGENPWGRRISVAVMDDGFIAAHYGGVPYPMATSYGDCTFIHIVDSFVHPAHRKGLKRPGLFVHTALPWFEECRAKGDAVLYGYPVPAAERVGERFLEYKRLRVVDYLCRDLAAAGSAQPGGIEIEPLGPLGEEVDALFAKVAGEKQCLARRDAKFLDWRYVRIPGDDYELYGARRNGELTGVLVLRPIHELVPDSCTIADWVALESDAETADAMLAFAADCGRQRGRKNLLAVFPDPSPEYAALRRHGFEVVPSSNYLERRLTHRIYHPEMTTEWLTEHWWYTLGDSDLV